MTAEIWLKAHEIAAEEIVRIRTGKWGGGHEPNPGLAAAIANFAIECAAKEREACAAIADGIVCHLESHDYDTNAVQDVADAIRKRSNEH